MVIKKHAIENQGKRSMAAMRFWGCAVWMAALPSPGMAQTQTQAKTQVQTDAPYESEAERLEAVRRMVRAHRATATPANFRGIDRPAVPAREINYCRKMRNDLLKTDRFKPIEPIAVLRQPYPPGPLESYLGFKRPKFPPRPEERTEENMSAWKKEWAVQTLKSTAWHEAMKQGMPNPPALDENQILGRDRQFASYLAKRVPQCARKKGVDSNFGFFFGLARSRPLHRIYRSPLSFIDRPTQYLYQAPIMDGIPDPDYLRDASYRWIDFDDCRIGGSSYSVADVSKPGLLSALTYDKDVLAMWEVRREEKNVWIFTTSVEGKIPIPKRESYAICRWVSVIDSPDH